MRKTDPTVVRTPAADAQHIEAKALADLLELIAIDHLAMRDGSNEALTRMLANRLTKQSDDGDALGQARAIADALELVAINRLYLRDDSFEALSRMLSARL